MRQKKNYILGKNIRKSMKRNVISMHLDARQKHLVFLKHTAGNLVKGVKIQMRFKITIFKYILASLRNI